MAKGDDIDERLINFAVQVIKLCAHLPKTLAGQHVADQLLRSGTAPAAHYAEARGAESTRDFIHKLKICLKELNESEVWLKVIARSELLPETRVRDTAIECNELCRIINASIRTTRSRRERLG